ncbi:MAG TPA: hypothetical protein VFY87_08420 [Geminicoccaceae bacterium]|nr:hypothetical protein [Geminicoccaceae bacterium]
MEADRLPGLAQVRPGAAQVTERSTSMFVLGDVLVTLEEVDGTTKTVPASPTRIGLELGRVANFTKIARVTEAGPEVQRCDPPMKLAVAIAEEPGGWRSPVLAGLTEVPILRPDGTVVTTPGYDAESRLYLHGGPFAPIGGDPKAALGVLLDAVREFPFVEPHHRSAALAKLLTTTCRRALPSAPMFGVSAREAGTGKGALVQLAAIMATGRRAPAAAGEQRGIRIVTPRRFLELSSWGAGESPVLPPASSGGDTGGEYPEG